MSKSNVTLLQNSLTNKSQSSIRRYNIKLDDIVANPNLNISTSSDYMGQQTSVKSKSNSKKLIDDSAHNRSSSGFVLKGPSRSK